MQFSLLFARKEELRCCARRNQRDCKIGPKQRKDKDDPKRFNAFSSSVPSPPPTASTSGSQFSEVYLALPSPPPPRHTCSTTASLNAKWTRQQTYTKQQTWQTRNEHTKHETNTRQTRNKHTQQTYNKQAWLTKRSKSDISRSSVTRHMLGGTVQAPINIVIFGCCNLLKRKED